VTNVSDEVRRPHLTDADCPTSMQSAIAVRDVSEEYAWLQGLECTCGGVGSFRLNVQALVQEEGSNFDALDCTCAQCGEQRSFFFNVDAVFAGYTALLRPGGADRTP